MPTKLTPEIVAAARIDAIEIGDFHVHGGHLTADLKMVDYGRTENLILYVEPFGEEEIGVEVYDSILDMLSLTVVAAHAAAKLNTAGRAALKQAAVGTKQNRQWLPQVRVQIVKPGVV